jgi:hypothetical protein
MAHWARRDWLAAIAAVVAPFVVCAGLSLYRDSFANTNAALVLVLVVVAVAAAGFRVAGLLAAASAALWFNYFLTQPYGQLTISRRADIETDVLLLLVGLSVTELAVWGRREAASASRRSGYLDGINAATAVVLSGEPALHVARDVSAQLVQLLGLTSCRYESGVAGLGQPARLRSDGYVEWHHDVWDVDRAGLPVDVEIELLVESAGLLKGRYMMQAAPNSRPSITERLVAVTLASQVAAARG